LAVNYGEVMYNPFSSEDESEIIIKRNRVDVD
jgi:hypothetical protein